jgi:hypothetical protein
MGTNMPVSIAAADINLFPIMGGIKTGKTNMLKCMLEMCARIPDTRLYVFDSAEKPLQSLATELNLMENYACDTESVSALAGKLRQLGIRRKELLNENPEAELSPAVIFIDDIVKFYGMADENDILTIDGLMSVCEKFKTHFVITGGKLDLIKDLTKIPERMFGYGHGALMGGNYAAYEYFNADMSYSKERSAMFPAGTGYVFNNRKFSVIKTPEYDRRNR